MSSFFAGALGAASLLLLLGLARRLVWLRRWRTGRRLPLGRLFARLRTRPDQERVIAAEAEALWREASGLRGEGQSLRGELGELLSAEVLDAASLSAVLDRRLTKLQALRTRAADGLARVHAVLDAEQRARAAALLRGGHGRRHAHGRC